MYRDGMSSREIGEAAGIPARTVSRYLKKHGTELRQAGPKRHDRLRDRAWLFSQYIGNMRSTPEIAKLIGASSRVVHSWLVHHGIETRDRGSEKGHQRFDDEGRERLSKAKRGRYCGSENPNWRGGQDNRDPDRNRYPAKQWSKAVRERDGKCVECGETRGLHAHHKKRWKDYPSLRYDVANGITLCQPCHQRAHGRGFKFYWNQ